MNSDTSTDSPKKVLVCGGRKYNDRKVVKFLLDILKPDIVIHGGGTGADSIAHSVARKMGADIVAFPADWERWGKAAGPIRNKMMIDQKPDIVIALPGGRGTEDTRRRAISAGIPLWTVSHRIKNEFEVHILDEYGVSFHRFEL